MEEMLKEELEAFLQSDYIQLTSVSGGDINQAYKITTSTGRYFLKYNAAHFSLSMFQAEQRGLSLLGEKAGIQVPFARHALEFKQGSGLLLDWIQVGSAGKNSWQSFAQQLAKLHQTKSTEYGLDHDNFIGSLEQVNSPSREWMDFYYEKRIIPQLKSALDQHLISTSMSKRTDSMFSLLSREIVDEGPSLVHGDLWSGNLLFDQQGEAVFIDPAVYYGHREMDIAMMRLFGGFSPGIAIYQEFMPLAHRWEDRLKFFQLYYILVHVNLFGGHYAQSAESIINHYASSSS